MGGGTGDCDYENRDWSVPSMLSKSLTLEFNINKENPLSNSKTFTAAVGILDGMKGLYKSLFRPTFLEERYNFMKEQDEKGEIERLELIGECSQLFTYSCAMGIYAKHLYIDSSDWKSWIPVATNAAVYFGSKVLDWNNRRKEAQRAHLL